jgi:C_GCAxxG_C_C family probable redox protein
MRIFYEGWILMNKESLIKKAYELGFDYEKTYHGCAQCAIAAIQDALEVRNDFVFKASSGFAAGCGLLRDGVCGGYAGGIMMMSLFFGRRREKFDNDRDENYRSYHMACALHEKFLHEYGTIICQDIHKKIFGKTFDLWNPEEKQLFEEAGAHRDKCTGVVATASSWTTEIILDEIEKESMKLDDFRHLIRYYKEG